MLLQLCARGYLILNNGSIRDRQDQPVKLKIALYLARRYLIAKWSLMSTLSILMIAFGLIALITVLSIMNGFHNTFKRKILETNSFHVIVQPSHGNEYTIDNDLKEPGLSNIASTLLFLLGYEPPDNFDKPIIK